MVATPVQPISSPPKQTEDDYFALDTRSEQRHDYDRGMITPMTGGTPNHNRIIVNLAVILKMGLKRQPYDVFSSDQRLWIPEADRYTYPDVMVTRDPLELKPGRKDTVMNPILLAEVLSKSTEDYDIGDKFSAYRTIPGFGEYLAISQSWPKVTHYVKQDRGWLLNDVIGLEATLKLESIALEIALADLYDKVEFSE
ncbi:Uma2 family endonuclease [Limnothrix sp. FACHB-708]|uniref:Uma2 family endonuclease n=1 Tax=unclassified Limnothrix TaxID=2632864 RepID=UPI0016853745|nr:MULTISPECIES: Uma2 family endonuclease [unclassified Limnothrix]MBD2554350.1 Uma2 family endonuclease [Limnothrix sp. FACHB-708]MBD2591490.1 Uma2 family endonuclease [Limnothrix sp. FACHB-406]